MVFLAIDHPASTRAYFNAAFQQFVGVDEAALQGEHWLQHVVEEDRADIEDALSAANRSRSPYSIEYRMIRADGSLRWVVERGVVRDGGGYAGSVADITDGRAARERLRSSERRFRALVEHSDDVVWLTDSSRKFLYASPSTERVLRWVDLPEQAFAPDDVHPDDWRGIEAAFAKAVTMPGLLPTLSVRLRDGQGRWRHFEVVLNNSVGDLDIGGIVVTLRDVTERLQSRETIDKLHAQLSSAKADQRRELAMALHDDTLQSMLAAQWSLSSLEGVVAPDSPAVRQLDVVQTALKSAVESARAVLFDLQAPDFSTVDLEETLRQLVDTHVMAGGAPTSLIVDCPKRPDADSASLAYRIVREALANTRKHAQATQVEIDLVVSLLPKRALGISVDIVDDGVGFANGEVERKRADGHFGLASIDDQLARMGGTLSIGPGVGTGVRVHAEWTQNFLES
jgi:PAS domain S-box-containing protein